MVGLDPNRKWTDKMSWTRRVDGPQVLEPTSTRYISRGVGCPRGTVSHSHVLGTLAPVSPVVAPDLAHVDTGRGAVRSTLRRSRDWIGWIGSGTSLHHDAASIIRNCISSGNLYGLLPRLYLGSLRRKFFCLSPRAPTVVSKR